MAVGPSTGTACATTAAAGKGLLVWAGAHTSWLQLPQVRPQAPDESKSARGAASGRGARARLAGRLQPVTVEAVERVRGRLHALEAAGAQVLQVEAMRSCGGSMSRCGQLGGSRGLGEARARTNLLRMSIEQSSAPYRPAHLSFRWQ